MAQKFRELVFTPSVKAAQKRFFGRSQDGGRGAPDDALGPDEMDFIETRDSFYLATVNEDGWPYIQHRGGPQGFCQVLGPHRIGFADYRGNRQLLTTGNVFENDRISLFLMDYPSRSRLKILGHARVLGAEEDPSLAQRLTPPDMERSVERLFLIDVVSYDWNCPQYITPRFTEAEIAPALDKLHAQIDELEAEPEANRNTSERR